MKFSLIDCHAHIVTRAIYPQELFTGRFCIPRVLLDALCAAVTSQQDMCFFMRALWGLMPKRLRRYRFLVQLYQGPWMKQAMYLANTAKLAGVNQMWILGLDIPDTGDYGPVKQWLIADLAKLKAAFDNFFLVFYPYDPRRDDAVKSLISWLDSYAFAGVKMYPALGFNVEDVRHCKPLQMGFEILQERQLPIVVHCSPGGIHGIEIRQGDSRWLSSPERWYPVLKLFPRLKVCFAHGTGEAGFLSLTDPKKGSWAWALRDLLLRYPGVYTDIAFHTGLVRHSTKYIKGIEKITHDAIRRKVLFGSDAPLHFGEYTYADLIRAAMKWAPVELMTSNARAFCDFHI